MIMEVSEDESEAGATISESAVDESGLNWYIVQCFALYEQKVRDRILQMQEDEYGDIIHRVLLPEEETVEIKNNELGRLFLKDNFGERYKRSTFL